MPKLTRRDCIQGTLAVMAAGGAAQAQPVRPVNPKRGGIKLAEVFGPEETQRQRLARQIGVNYAITGAGLGRVPRDRYVESLTKLVATFKAAGMTVAGVESDPVSTERIKFGRPGRDEEIENYKAAIDALGKAGIPMICWNFMAGLGWSRTRVDLPERGGALTTEFDLDAANKLGPTPSGEISEDKLWENIEYFLKAVIPAAEKARVKMALHPDDPPLSPVRGLGRIITSAKAYRRVMDIAPSPYNGVTFCQANFKLMGEDLEAVAREFCTKKKIFFVHFRDVDGTKTHFHETFHDNGPTDMARMLQTYSKYGFDGPMRPDHAPVLEGEANDRPGYAMTGKVFAFGYMKGIMDALHLAYE